MTALASYPRNEFDQPIGVPVPDWKPVPRPPHEALIGRFCRVEPLNADRHAAQLFAANRQDDGRMWTYLAIGPFDTLDSYTAWVEQAAPSDDPLFFAIIDRATDQAVGVAAYLRIDPANGTVEIGHLAFSPLMQRSPIATEAMFLMMQCAFDLGYRRYEWKCNARNAKSRAAAQRYGLSYEGIFRQVMVIKGHNRDTAWFAAVDSEWPRLKAAFTQWLDPANFDSAGQQRVRLSDLTAPILVVRQPAE